MKSPNSALRKAAGVFAALIIFFATGCAQEQQTDSQTEEPIQIGGIVFLTGSQSALGEQVQNAFNIAVSEINSQGGVNGRPLEVLYKDSQDSPRTAISAFRNLTQQDVAAILSTGDVVSLRLAPFADEAQIPLVSTVAAGASIPSKSPWVFRVFIGVKSQATTIAEFAADSLNLNSVAVLRINNQFGNTSLDVFKETFESSSGNVVASEAFAISDRNVRSQISKLRTSNPDGIYVTGFGNAYGAAIKQIRELGYEGVLLADNFLSAPFVQKQTAPANEGAYFTSTRFSRSSEDPQVARFVNKYQQQFGKKPDFTGAFAYDALRLTATAIERGGMSPDSIRQALNNIEDFDGLVGEIDFTQEGDLNFPLVVKRISNGEPSVISGKSFGERKLGYVKLPESSK